ncbi:small terminase subunit [Hylemonella gracilis str. Niagara R]|uniref:Small terminase subunit n=2 Tax=Hylemonella gracilis TaxID=80880 RepID=A0A016XHT3_9BURK|nr:small terminase subunit [Hylemonella gracilis str. Niagara R]
MRHGPAQTRPQVAATALAVSSPFSAQGNAYQLMLAQLAEHRAALKEIKSVERKAEFKAAILPVYDAWVDGVLASDKPGEDFVFTTALIWHIDAGHYARAWQLARHALAHAMPLPPTYERDLATALIDEYAWAFLAGKMTAAEALEILPQVLETTQPFDAPDQARSKLHKALAYALLGREQGAQEVDYEALPLQALQSALPLLRRALELDQQAGVKKDIERVERNLAKKEPPPA